MTKLFWGEEGAGIGSKRGETGVWIVTNETPMFRKILVAYDQEAYLLREGMLGETRGSE